MNQLYDVIIVGGGPAGLSAAYSAWQNGAKKIVVIERDRELGGILQQCIHNGFGLHHFKEELTGPGYAHRCIELVADKPEIETLVDTMVLDVQNNKTVIAVNPEKGLLKLEGKTVIPQVYSLLALLSVWLIWKAICRVTKLLSSAAATSA